LKSYKEWLGRSYLRLTLYLSPICKLEVVDLDGADLAFDEWPEVEDQEYNEATALDPPFPAAGHSASKSVGTDIPPRALDDVLNSFVASDFL